MPPLALLVAISMQAELTNARADQQPNPTDLYYQHPFPLYCDASGTSDVAYIGLSECSPHASSTHVIVGNVSHSSQPTLSPPDGGPAIQSYNATTTSEGPAKSKYFLDLEVSLVFALCIVLQHCAIASTPAPSQTLNLCWVQTGVIFVDTLASSDNVGSPVYTTVELDPAAAGSESAQYLAALGQLLVDTTNTAYPPPAYAETCNPPVPQLDSAVAYLRAAVADATI